MISLLLVVTVITVPSAFFAPAPMFTSFSDCISWSSFSSNFFFHSSKDNYKYHKYISYWLHQFRLILALAHFFHQCCNKIISNTTRFVFCIFRVKIKRNFTVFQTMTWYLESCSISILMYWIGEPRLGIFTSAICFFFPSKASFVLCSWVEYNSP